MWLPQNLRRSEAEEGREATSGKDLLPSWTDELKSVRCFNVSCSDAETLNVSPDEFTSAAKHKIAVINSSSCEIPEVKTSTRSSACVRQCVAALVHGLQC